MHTQRQPTPTTSPTDSAVASGKNRLRIAYLTMDDPNDRRSWSGTQYCMAQALEKHCGEVVRIGPLQPFSLTVGKVIQRLYRMLSGQRYLYVYTKFVSNAIARVARRKLSKTNCDVIFAPAGSAILGRLKTSTPIVYLSDATFKLMGGYYGDFSNLVQSHTLLADSMERWSIETANQSVFPSEWAARSAIADYGADAAKVHVVPFGANLDDPPSREQALQSSNSGRCQLLFVGVDWVRKGGQIAFETLLELERLGIPAELTVVGCTPPDGISHVNLRTIKSLNKNDLRERSQLDRLFREANFFVLPTRAECFSIALCEANAYGIPILSTQTGGLPELVRDGVNGFLLPLEAPGSQYAAKIRDVYTNLEAYQQLRRSAREQFETRLNWDSWGKRMNAILRAAVVPMKKAS